MAQHNEGRTEWALLQGAIIVLTLVVSTYVMASAGLRMQYPYLGVPAALLYYVLHYWHYREKGWLGDPVPIIPWRVAVVLLLLSVLSFAVGLGVTYFVRA